eukprot:TRINITY_DN4426_c0_g1_i1.p1 TRINITY_DN4426_c0_g1~~TRINITY_DN4426_c0_g1_i1.p1  ORF type:complete len:196 (-),score=30.44 TRINITY_DN4426_c0_g1_i1:70-657(-)
MRFFFCGGLDCPDWLLVEIAIISKLSSLRLKVLCGQIINSMCGGQLDWPKISKIMQDANFDTTQVKQTLSGIEYVISSAVRFDVEERTFTQELTMIGLPKESAEQLVKAYTASKDRLQESMTNKTLQLPSVAETEWRVDYVLASSSAGLVQKPLVSLCLQPTSGAPVALELPVDKFRALHAELKAARELMKTVEA